MYIIKRFTVTNKTIKFPIAALHRENPLFPIKADPALCDLPCHPK